ncbi:hypothetical protein GF318_01130, partial [Candidatus Micrarchaeota archaeon]|nr:hypothetical protein [Candidatus Micrarchaeota archaeon]
DFPDGHVLEGSVISGNQLGGINSNSYLQCDGCRLFNNTYDILVNETSAFSHTVNLTSTIFDNPLGNLQNYTNISLNDSYTGPLLYTLSWSSNESTIPSSRFSFRDKYLDIENLSGTVSIDAVVWQWTDAEASGYLEKYLELWEHNGTGWTLLNNSPDTAANTLSQFNLNPASTYGLFQFDAPVCKEIGTSGTYSLVGNLQGAPVSVSPSEGSSLVDFACIKIKASDVVFDCNGYNLTHNNTNTAAGIIVAGNTTVNYTNVTVKNCGGIKDYRYGVLIHRSSNDEFTNSTVLESRRSGVYIYNSDYNELSGLTLHSNVDHGITMFANYNDIYDIVSYNNSGDGIRLDSGSANNSLYNVTTYDNSLYGIEIYFADENNITDSYSYNNVDGIIITVGDSNRLEDNLAYENSRHGINLATLEGPGSANNALSNNTVFNNTQNGIHLDTAGGTALYYNLYYNNGRDFVVENDPFAFFTSYSMTGDVFTSPSGSLENFTNLSISDSMSAGEIYGINWSANISVPPDRFSFNRKFVDISNLSTTACSIDSVTWNWNDSELNTSLHNESLFELWKYNTSWTKLNGSPDTAANTLNLSSHNPASIYAILQNNATPQCPVISSSGTYLQESDFSGAPNTNLPLSGSACVYINSSDVVYDCDSYGMSHDGSNNTYGVFVGDNLTNVTVKNCRNITSYDYGIYLYRTNQSLVAENTVTFNTGISITLDEGHYNNVENNTINNNSVDGITVDASTYNNITNNAITNSSDDGISVLSNADANEIRNNNVSFSQDNGIEIRNSDDITVDSNNVFENGGDGISVDTATGVDLPGNNADNNGGDGISVTTASTINLSGNGAVGNGGDGISIEASNDVELSNNDVSASTDNGVEISGGSDNVAVDNTDVFDNGGDGISASTSTDIGITGGASSGNADCGISVSYCYNVTIDPIYFCNNMDGLAVNNSNTTLIEDSVACNNTRYGIHILDSNDTTFNLSRSYNNSLDLLVNNTLAYSTVMNITSHLFDSPQGNVQNCTNITLYDEVSSNSAYSFSWTTNSSALPADYLSFEEKYLNITAWNGTVQIDNVTWRYRQDEVGTAYDENYFELWKYNGSWSNVSAARDTGANTIRVQNLNPESDYGILQQNVSMCMLINSSGAYELKNNISGAPIDASELPLGYDYACIKIEAADVLFDCKGYQIANNGTANAIGILVSGTFSGGYPNITVQNCPDVTLYKAGVFAYYAENDTLQNVTAFNNTEHGFYIRNSGNLTIDNSTARNSTSHGFYSLYSDDNNFTSSHAFFNSGSGFYLQYSDGGLLESNSAYENDNSGFATYWADGWGWLDNTAYGNGDYGFSVYANSDRNVLDGNTAHSNTNDGFRIQSNNEENNITNCRSHNNSGAGFSVYANTRKNYLENNTAYNNSLYGFYVSNNATNTTLLNSTAYNNSEYGIHLSDESNDTNVTYAHLFNNTLGEVFAGSAAGEIAFSELFVDSPAGSFENYTNFSITDDVSGSGEGYAIAWSANASGLPSSRFSFEQKFANISIPAPYSAPSIDEIVWHWTDAEVASQAYYNESKFELWRYNSSGWTMLNDSADTTGNMLALHNHDPSSNYGILQSNVSANCPIIATSGSHVQTRNFTGAPNAVGGIPQVNRACVVIASSDVVFDCNGYNITNNGTADAAGIIINGSSSVNYTNVTIRNCPLISDYGVGIEAFRTDNGTVMDSEVHNSTLADFIVYASSNITLRNNLGRDTNTSFEVLDSINTVLDNNTAYNVSDYGFFVNRSNYSTFNGNEMDTSAFLGFVFQHSHDSVVDNSSSHNVSLDGFVFTNSSRNNLTNLTAYNNSGDGIDLADSADARIVDCATYDNNGGIHATTNSDNLVLTDNYLYNNTFDGAWISDSDNITFTNNTARNNGNFGIRLVSSVAAGFIENNVYDSSYDGFYIEASSNVNMTNNTAEDNVQDGFHLKNVSGCNILNNTGRNNINGSGFGAGQLSASCTYVDNTAYGNGNEGMDLEDVSDFSVEDNIIYNNTGGGIVIQDSNDTNITNNLVYGHTSAPDTFGIQVHICSNVLAAHNNASDNGAGIGVIASTNSRGAGNNRIVNNTVHDTQLGGIIVYISDDTLVANNTASNNGHSSYIVTGLDVYDAFGSGQIYYSADNNTLSGNRAYNDSGFILLMTTNATVEDNTAANASGWFNWSEAGLAEDDSGFILSGSNSSELFNNTAYNFTASSSYGFYLNKSHYNLVKNSTAYLADIGFRLDNSTYNNLTHSESYEHGHHGMTLQEGSRFNHLENNTLYNNADSGIGLELSDNNTLANNTAFSNNLGLAMQLSDDNYLLDNAAHSNTQQGFSVSAFCTGNEFINNTAYNNSLAGFLVYNSSNSNNFTSVNATGNFFGFYVLGSEDNRIDPSYFCNNTYGVYINMSNGTVIDDSVMCNNSQHGIYILDSNDTLVNRSEVFGNSNYGIYQENSTCSNFTDSNITENTIGGIRFDANSSSSGLFNNYVCFNGMDLNNLGSSNSGELDSCDSFAGWSENGHLGCEFSCTKFWHRFFGDVNGTIVLTDVNAADYVYEWEAEGFNIYFADYDSAINWGQLQAIGRNTTNGTSSNDFTELDTAFSSSGFEDNITSTYSSDGTSPLETRNYTVFNSPVDNVPVANSTVADTVFQTGILWDTGDGGAEYSNAFNQSTVWIASVNGSTADAYGTYDYLIQVPYTLSTYEAGNDLVAVYLELR